MHPHGFIIGDIGVYSFIVGVILAVPHSSKFPDYGDHPGSVRHYKIPHALRGALWLAFWALILLAGCDDSLWLVDVPCLAVLCVGIWVHHWLSRHCWKRRARFYRQYTLFGGQRKVELRKV